MNPPAYYRDLLGLPEAAPWLDVPSPFAAEQLSVRIARHVSTRFDRREASLAPIVELIAAQYAERPGNYLAFFSSFDYLERTLASLRAAHPELPVWAQARRMDEAAASGLSRPLCRHRSAASVSPCSVACFPKASTCRASG